MVGVNIVAKSEHGGVTILRVRDDDNYSVGDIVTDMYRGTLAMGTRPSQTVVSLQCREGRGHDQTRL